MYGSEPATGPMGATDGIVRAALDWWALAGVDCATSDTPRGWLATPERKTAIGTPGAPTPATANDAPIETDTPMPATLDALAAWIASPDSQPEAKFSDRLILPQLTPHPDLMILTDVPTAADMESGVIQSGEEGALLAAILRTIGLAPTVPEAAPIARGSLLLARPPGGVVDEAFERFVSRRARHIVGVLRPRRMLIVGERTSRALSPTDERGEGRFLPFVNLDGVNIDAVHIPATLLLLRQPGRKAAAWRDLRRWG